jgi:phage-related protein
MAKERRGRFGGFSPDLDREGERAQRRKLWEEALLRDAAARPSDTARVKTLLARLDDWAEAQQHRTDLPCKVTRVAREIALANLSPLMTPQAALTYASWMMASERGWAHQESFESPESSPDLSSPEPPKLSSQGALASCFGFLAAPAPASPGASVLAARLRPDAGAPGEAPSEAVLEEVLALARADGPGDPLPAELLTIELRKQLGEAATRVRLHTGAAANQAAQRLGASAFTVEHDIYFAAGAYAPGTSEGDRLLRHELTHVGQHERGLLAGATGAEMVASSSSAEAEALAAENAEPAEPAEPAETSELVEWAGVRRPAHARAGKPGRPAAGSVEAPYVRLRSQLLEAAATGVGAEAALASAEPAVAATVLRELRGTPVPGQNATALQLISRSAGAQVSRLLGGGVGAPSALAAAAPPVAPPVASQVSQARFEATGGAEAPAASGRPGRPLEEEARRKMEFAFGTDFANVRILEGTEAQAMGAVAFARGEDLHFAPGQYDPGSWQGLELIGHELAHVVQQRAGRVAMGKGGVNTDPSLEREADDLGGRAARGERVATAGSASRDASAASWAEVETPGAELRAPSPGSAVEAEGSAAPAARAPDARLRGQLLEAAAAGRGADDALAAAEPATAERVLRELRGTSVPGHGETALQLVARRAETPIIGRLIGQGSRGQALPAAVAEELSPFVGPQVTGAAQLHTGEAADLLAAAHHARAVTIGDQIYFAHGQFAPGTEPGDELLVHELTHVDQAQRGELNTAAAKSITSGEALTTTEAEADLRARFAVIELHGPTAPLPALAAPSAQPTTEGERATKLAAQQTRVALAQQDDIPNTPTPPPPALTASGSAGGAGGMGGLGNVMSAIRGLVSEVAANVAAGVSTVSATINATTAPSVGAYAETFDAPPSVQAFGLWDATGAKATTQAAAEQTRFDAALPERLNGPAAAAAPPAPSAAPAAPAAPAAVAATPPPAPAATVPPAAVAPPTVIAAPVSTTATAQGFEELPSTLEVEPSPGVPLLSELAGATDPVLAQIGQHQGASAAVTAFTAAKEQILSGPGPALVQPTVLDEKLVVARSTAIGAMPGLPVVPEMAQLKQWNLPGDALAGFDGIVGPRMHAHLTQARTQMTTAEVKRDVDRSKAVDDGKAKARQAHLDASKQQQAKVAESRIQIATHQSSALLKHDAEFKKLDAQSDEQKKTTVGQVDARVKADQAKVESDFAIAQQQAVDAKGAAEAEVARLKAEGQAQYDAEEANAPPQPTEPKPEDPAQMKFGDRFKGAVGWVGDRIEDGVEWVDENIVDPVVEGLRDAWNAFEDFVVYLANKLVELVKSIGEAIDNALRLAAEAIGTIIDTVKQLACTIIDAARDFLCEALRLFGEWLTTAITLLLGSVFPELAAALNSLIDAAVGAATAAINAIADGLKSVVTALCDTVKTAIDTAITLYRTAVQLAVTLVEAVVTGDWSQIALAALEAVLKLLGIDPEAFYAFVGKTKDSIVKILSNPGAFVRNLVEAVKLGFQQFGDNFLTHLKNGVVEWLFGTFAEAGIQMPTSFDVAGVFYLVAQVLGLSWPSLRGKVVQQVGQENAEQLTFVEQYLEPLLAGDFSGLWEQLQGDLSTLWETVIGGAKQWLMEQLVTQAILKIATMWNPAGALVELIRTAWHVYQWVRENAQRIKELLGAVVDSIAAIVAGNISGAANSIEASLAKLVPITISLFAHLLGIGGIAGKMKTIVLKVSAKVEQAIAKLIARVKARFKPKKPTTGTGTDGKPDPNKPVGARITFKVRSATHTQYIDKGVPMVASTPSSVRGKIDEWRPFLSEYPAADSKTAGSLIGKVIAIEGKVDTLVSQVQAGTAQDSALVAKQRELADALSELWTFLLNLPPVIATGTMMGEGHTLTADPDPEKPEIRLASVEQEALTKVQAAITQAQGMDVLDPTKNRAVQALQKIRSELATLQNLVTRAISNNAVDVVPQFQLKKQMEASAKAIMDSLKTYGDDFKVHDVIDLPQFTTDEDYRLLAENVGQARLEGAFTSWTNDVKKSGFREGEKEIWAGFAIVEQAARAPALAALADAAKGAGIQTKTGLSTALTKKGEPIKEAFHRTAGDQVVEQVKDQGKKEAESVETKAAIDKTAYVPNTTYGKIETPKEKPAPDPALKAAVAAAGGIVAFMKGMATVEQAGGMTYAELVEAWKVQANVDELKNQFRAAHTGQHEWIPSNMILEVIERAQSAAGAIHAAAWIDLHHTLRSPTPNLIFKPSYALGSVSIEGQQEQILSGHSGAVYYPRGAKKPKLNSGAAAVSAVPSTTKQNEWHDELRGLFRTNATIGTVITAMDQFFQTTIWDGDEGDVPAAVFRDYVTSTGDPVDWNGLVAAQKARYKEVQGNFTACRNQLTAFLNS